MDSKQDTFNESVSSILERKVRGWLSGVIEDMRRSSPVQQWLDSLPVSDDDNAQHGNIIDITLNGKKDNEDSETVENKDEELVTDNTVIETNNDILEDTSLEVPGQREQWKRKSLESGVLSAQTKSSKLKLQRDHSIQSEGCPPRMKNPLLRDHSLQSDASGSSGSSVMNVLGARKVDAESVLLALGFGPSEKQQKLQRIPDRFLVPSKLKGISTEQFIKNEQHSMRMHDCGVFGYRGLTEHCTPVCRFMKPVASRFGEPYQVPQIAVQSSYILGNPHVPPSTIVAKIIDCLLQDEMCREEAVMRTRHSIADMRSAPAIHAHILARLRST